MFDLECGLRLRGIRNSPSADYDNFLDFLNNVKVAQYSSFSLLAPQGDEVKSSLQEKIKKAAEMFCIIETIPTATTGSSTEDAPKFVGMTHLWVLHDRGHRHASFGIGLLPEFWGKGYGTAITKFVVNHAFHHLNIHRITLSVIEGNDRAVSVYKVCGFVEEGRQRQAVWVEGGWKDIIQMGILVDDWKKMPNS